MTANSTIPLQNIPADREHAHQSRGVTIQPVRWRDLHLVSRLQHRSFEARLAYRLPTLVYLYLWPGVVFLVCRDGEEITGCAIGDRHGKRSRIVNICVDPATRRQGIASLLLQRLESALPPGNIILMVQAENEAARALYIKEGYKETGRTRHYYGDGRDGIWMKKAEGGRRKAEG